MGSWGGGCLAMRVARAAGRVLGTRGTRCHEAGRTRCSRGTNTSGNKLCSNVCIINMLLHSSSIISRDGGKMEDVEGGIPVVAEPRASLARLRDGADDVMWRVMSSERLGPENMDIVPCSSMVCVFLR